MKWGRVLEQSKEAGSDSCRQQCPTSQACGTLACHEQRDTHLQAWLLQQSAQYCCPNRLRQRLLQQRLPRQ